VIRVGDRDALDVGRDEIADSPDLQRAIARGPHRDSTTRVDGFRAVNDQSLLLQLLDVSNIRRREQIHWRAILDLAREHAGRTKHEGDFRLLIRCKLTPDFFERGSQI